MTPPLLQQRRPMAHILLGPIWDGACALASASCSSRAQNRRNLMVLFGSEGGAG